VVIVACNQMEMRFPKPTWVKGLHCRAIYCIRLF
jgi:hypothetical protein